jgi:hypothetical protein
VKTVVLAGTGVAVAVALLSPIARRWYLTWGATRQEVTGALPGDELIPDPDLLSTRAVTIDAGASSVWPWLVQMGSGRGGAYTYDWIENLFGLDMHSADEILPQFQHLAAGDVLPLGPKGPGMRVKVCEPGRTLVFHSTDELTLAVNELTTNTLQHTTGGGDLRVRAESGTLI